VCYLFNPLAIYISKTLVQVGVGVFLLHYGFEIYKKQKTYDRSTAKVSDQINKARAATPSIFPITKIMFAGIRQGDGEDFLKSFYTWSKIKRDEYLFHWRDSILNTENEINNQSEARKSIWEIKNDGLEAILSVLSSEKLSFYSDMNKFIKKTVDLNESSQSLLDEWKRLSGVEQELAEKIKKLHMMLDSAHDENVDQKGFERKLDEYCRTNDFDFVRSLIN
jgi:hypothetical protein